MHPAAQITGRTQLYGLVGDPLTTAKSPELLNRLFIEQRVDAVCVPFGVKADDLSAFVTGASMRIVKSPLSQLSEWPNN